MSRVNDDVYIDIASKIYAMALRDLQGTETTVFSRSVLGGC
jgi:hypothetical protein